VNSTELIGRQADVISGPHEGRGGEIKQVRSITIGNADPEPYVVIEYTEKNCFDELQTDQISVPARRVVLR